MSKYVLNLCQVQRFIKIFPKFCSVVENVPLFAVFQNKIAFSLYTYPWPFAINSTDL